MKAAIHSLVYLMLAWFATLPSGTDGGHPQQVSVQSIRTVDKTEYPVYSADEFGTFSSE